ncbi:transglutaminase domain-containing protein [Luteibaculum oceani]|uniref:Transglutaminase-like domain-containing protein n=1 Tax=Luteibaculum oceani TaxID=1294296 RepID=A0A5C6VA18_9FLAO|nr:transglutaminase domain-containing protein [Luteibaculum oceani]TXC81670.1 hypothetical protein FRX97_03910 [Luteibaculum oceani]
MKINCLAAFLLLSLSLFSSPKEHNEIPKKIRESVPELAQYLTADFKSEREKVRALYTWVINNIEYDYEKTQKGKVTFFNGPENVLKEQKAVCTGYVFLLGALLSEVDIEWEEVQGYTNSGAPYFIPSIVLDDHAWIAIKINGKWELADPTWDAGYIGSLYKEKEPDPVDKQEKYIKRIEEQNKKLKEKGRDLIKVPEVNTDTVKEYTGKIGFVKDPGYSWFLVSSDSFLTRHLPSNPMWQLRHDTLGVRDFVQGPKRVKMHCEKMYDNSFYPYEEVLHQYEQLEYLEKLIFLAEDAIAYFPNNSRTKALRYFRFLQILNDEEYRKFIKENIPERESRGMFTRMKEVMDTTMNYIEITRKNEYVREREWDSFYKQSYKLTSKRDKQYIASYESEKELHDKSEDLLEKEQERLEKEQSKIAYEKIKFKKKYPYVVQNVDTVVDKSFRTLSPNAEALATLGEEFEILEAEWLENIDAPALLEIQFRNQFNVFLLEKRKEALTQKFVEYNRFIDTLDRRLQKNFDALDRLYSEELKQEMLPIEFFKICKQITGKSKVLLEELRLKQINGEIKDIEVVEEVVNNFVYAYWRRLEALNQDGYSFIDWNENYLKEVQKDWRKLAVLTKVQPKLNKAKLKFLEEEFENSHKREIDMTEMVEEKTEDWKKEIDKIL